MRCMICGAENAEDAEFCSRCTNRIPGTLSHQPAFQLWAVAAGLVVGSLTGLFMGMMTPYWPGPPYLLSALLVYGLGLGVFLVCQLLKGVFSEETRAQLSPFSIGFVGAYYFFLIGYLMYLVG